MVTLASCRMAGLRTPERGAKHCRNLTPGGHLNLARTGQFYFALITSVRIMYIMTNTCLTSFVQLAADDLAEDQLTDWITVRSPPISATLRAPATRDSP